MSGRLADGAFAAVTPEILFYSDLPFGYHMADAEERMSRFAARGYRVHYVEQLGIRNPRPRHVLRVLRTLSSRPQRSTVPFEVSSPKLLPPRRAPLVGRLNRAWLSRQLLELVEDPTGTVFWLRYPTPELVPLVEGQPWRVVVYEAIDDHEQSPGMNDRLRRLFREAEQRILARAGVVFVSSEAMEERLAKLHPNVIRAPAAAVDLDAFSSPFLDAPNRRVAVYAGSIDFRFDAKIVAAAAERLPDWRFEIAGPIEGPAKGRLGQLPNVRLAGRLPAADIPTLLAGASVCLMPYRQDAFTDTVFPVKLVEYLAAGKPIVSTPIAAVREFSDVVAVGADPDLFAEAIVAAAASDSEAERQTRIDRARPFSWERRMDQLQHAVEAAARRA
jgi:glycosyltransferase involved in cell wall biosynthesis